MLQAVIEQTEAPEQTYPDIVRYICGIHAAVPFRQAMRAYHLSSDEVSEIKQRLDSNDITISRAWRAAFKAAEGKHKTAYRILSEPDVKFMEQYLVAADWKKLRWRAEAFENYNRRYIPTTSLSIELVRYSWEVAKRKLQFIANYDPAISLDDLVGDMVMAGLASLRWYDWEDNPKRLKHRVFKTIRNKAMNLLEYYTAEKRCRLKVYYDENGGRQYYCTTYNGLESYSGDGKHTVPAGIWRDIAEHRDMVGVCPYERVENLEDIMSRLTPREKQACAAFLGIDKGQVIDIWLTRCGIHAPDLNDRQLLKVICRYYKVDLRRMKRKLRECFNA
jgi:hypothetical protein